MNLRHITARAAVAATATAMLAGGLVATTGVAAHADSKSADYNCTNGFTPDILPLSLTATADLSGFPSVATGFSVPAGLVSVDIDVSLSQDVVAGLKANSNISTVGVTSDGMDFGFGKGKVPLAGFSVDAIAKADMPSEGPYVMSATTSNDAFKMPAPGTNPVKMPTSFSLTNVIPIPIDCTIVGSAPTVTSYTVIKQTPMLTAKGPKSAKAGKSFKVSATVKGNVVPTGKVTVKDGKATVGTGTLKKGKATITVKGLSAGTHNIVVSYAGDKNSFKSNDIGLIVAVK